MSAPKNVQVKENIKYLRTLLKLSSEFLRPRIIMLIEIKKSEGTGISKRALAELVGVNPNSIQTWRSLYISGGITLLLSHKKIGYKPSLITAEEREAIDQKLKDPKNGLRGYTELMRWIEQEYQKSIHYNTLYKYCVRNFGSSVKVARKSHVKKDPEAVETLKKTSQISASKLSPAKKNSLKK
ncbi:MAG TPA: winged helix-turn-helix domain-containing protein [Candidatus Paceibacterota bacterium]|nr:winged helix-turn-helix domain-containing protein [Candidatus Paceibacterota bacterium]